ncbi:MAG: NADH-quinone oxidoreductase subunit L [Lewinellaceae bacterium]|nr:NADH-quinone oxidoreductase subunit L [Lewinellaceae bacterium]MCB9288273.1 NADH-quinone oxidoreductase subunit L [Lewinellaceae bacterium]
MLEILWLIPAIPLAGFFLLSVMGGLFSRKAIAWVGAGSIGLSALLAILVGIQFFSAPPAGYVFRQSLWSWIEAGEFASPIALHLDPLSLIFVLVVTVVGFLIHLYSVEFMEEDEGYRRFFAYMNLFVGAMLILVLADSLILLYLGWEGVGLGSYLLIGFWYQDPSNGYAARKAFIITRVGDTAMALGLFLLFTSFGTLDIPAITIAAPQTWSPGGQRATLAALLLLGGALGKSAQLPLQTWLPDAMAGPTPVSALIHAATMVTAGVYLIARMHAIFELAPAVMALIAAIGAATLLLSGFSALTQSDIKRVLAYSTISQIGYMFLALGLGAWSAAIFHFFTHAFFKALLFLGAGAVIMAMQDEHDMFKMGGLRKKMPVTFWTFTAGAASLAALPLVTAGFYSKDQILWYAWAGENGSPWLWAAGALGALITAAYTARMVILTFFGEAKREPDRKPGVLITIPLVVLAVLALGSGFIELPHNMGEVQLFSGWLSHSLPSVAIKEGLGAGEFTFQLAASVLVLGGLFLGYLFYLRRPELATATKRSFAGLHRLWFHGWGFNWLYDQLFVRPFEWLSAVNRRDFIDYFYTTIARANRGLYPLLSRTQSGRLRWYAFGIGLGAVIIITIIALS